MKLFKDSLGREWTVDVNMAGMMRVKDLAGVNLVELWKGDPSLGAQLTTDPFLVAKVVGAFIRPQLEAKQVSPDALLEALDGLAFAGAFAALAEGLTDFFRQSGRAEHAAALTAQMRALAMAADMARERVEALDVKAIVEAAFQKRTIAT
jgi:hypothetical protein